MRVVAIDPGYKQSAVVVFDGTSVQVHFVDNNEAIREWLFDYKQDLQGAPCTLVIEQMQMFRSAFGVGVEVFDSVRWSGRFQEIWYPRVTHMLLRAKVRGHLSAIKGGDAAVRQGLIVRFGGYKDVAIGKKKTPGPLYGVTSHEWSALALAVTWWDLFRDKPPEIRPGVVPQHDGAPPGKVPDADF